MRAVLAFLICLAAIGPTTLTAVAEEKKCKPGQEYDEAQGKCLTIRGS